MSREYSRFMPTFWTGETGKIIRGLGRDTQVVAIYLFTCASSNMLGCYYLPLVLMAHETGVDTEGCRRALEALQKEGFCLYDPLHEYVFVPEMAKYQVGESLSPGDNVVKFISKQAKEIKHATFRGMFLDRYREPFHLDKDFPDPFKKSKVSSSLRMQTLERDGFRCVYCGADSKTDRIEVDHVVPESKGGKTELDNLAACCFRCNNGKADRIIKGPFDQGLGKPLPSPSKPSNSKAIAKNKQSNSNGNGDGACGAPVDCKRSTNTVAAAEEEEIKLMLKKRGYSSYDAERWLKRRTGSEVRVILGYYDHQLNAGELRKPSRALESMLRTPEEWHFYHDERGQLQPPAQSKTETGVDRMRRLAEQMENQR